MLERYLERRAICREIVWSKKNIPNVFVAIIIPVLSEDDYLEKLLFNLSAIKDDFLVILVINNRKNAAFEQKENNRRVLEKLRSNYYPNNLNLGWIDCCSDGNEFADNFGVGLARKIGMDSVVKLFKGEGILLSLDADCLVELDYIKVAKEYFKNKKNAAACFDFEHQAAEDENLQAAIDNYEKYLHHYVNGLRKINSPYAYHSIGSIIAVTCKTYVLADGMPGKKMAAEDFYFLQNVAKHCKIDELPTKVFPSARISERTLFGTGQKIKDYSLGLGGTIFYDDEAFELLKQFFNLAEASINSVNPDFLSEISSKNFKNFLNISKFVDNWHKWQKNYKNDLEKHISLHRWFDGLKTLQIIKIFDKDLREKNLKK